MTVSVFDLFKIGIGPSSSHTVGPMKAGHRFVLDLESRRLLDRTARVEVNLFGSLAMTGHGHATDVAIILGLLGQQPDTVDPDAVNGLIAGVRDGGRLALGGSHDIPWTERTDLVFRFGEFKPEHSNTMTFDAFDADGTIVLAETFYSVGGGFVLSAEEAEAGGADAGSNIDVPYPFSSARDLLAMGVRDGVSIAQIARANELGPPERGRG